MRLIYPALFHNEDGAYWVEFPDLIGCQSFGDTVEETIIYAKEALRIHCITLLEHKESLNSPSDFTSIKTDENSFVLLIDINLPNKWCKNVKTVSEPPPHPVVS